METINIFLEVVSERRDFLFCTMLCMVQVSFITVKPDPCGK